MLHSRAFDRIALSFLLAPAAIEDEAGCNRFQAADDARVVPIVRSVARCSARAPVLIAGGEPGAAFFIRCILHRAGIQRSVNEVSDGAALIEYLAIQTCLTPLPAVIILFDRPQRMNCDEFLERARAQKRFGGIGVLIVRNSSDLGAEFIDLNSTTHVSSDALPWALPTFIRRCCGTP
jgi:hypothetical protein